MALLTDLSHDLISLILSFLPHRKDGVVSMQLCQKIFTAFKLYRATVLKHVYFIEISTRAVLDGRFTTINYLVLMMWRKNQKNQEIYAIFGESAFEALNQDGL